jgi:LacI family transcriptional regulator
LKAERLTRSAFIAWFGDHRPDVVIGHSLEIADWMEAAGASVPASHGFASLNVWTAGGPCAGLDLRPALIGSLAVEQLVSRLRRHEIGLDGAIFGITVPPSWIDGPTVRLATPRPPGGPANRAKARKRPGPSRG